MTGRLVPRLSLRDSRALFEELRGKSPDDLRAMVRFSHPRAFPAATGGAGITPDELAKARRAVLDDLPTGNRQHQSALAAALGEALATHLPLIPGDVAHFETWSFLTLCVFPDVVATRWPKFPEDRFIGANRNRNYLAVCWRRHRLFGEVLTKGGSPLQEDELVQLTERTSLARNPVLIRAAAEQLCELPVQGRMDLTREFSKRLTFWTGVSLVHLWTEEYLEARIGDLVDDVREELTGTRG